MMTDNQFYVLITTLAAGLAGISAVIRWSVGRITKALDDNSTAMLKNTESNAVLSTKIDSISVYVQRNTPPTGVPTLPFNLSQGNKP